MIKLSRVNYSLLGDKFMTILIGLLVVVAPIILWVVFKYNSFIRLKNMVGEAWSGIDVQLKRRYDLIPNLVETVKGYSTHEKGVFENIARLRTASMQSTTVQEKSQAESGLGQALKTLFAVAESYPELKANQNFIELQKELTNVENQLQLARRYYNGVVRDYNIALHSFPGNIIASVSNFKEAQFFELSSSTERENPQVKF